MKVNISICYVKKRLKYNNYLEDNSLDSNNIYEMVERICLNFYFLTLWGSI